MWAAYFDDCGSSSGSDGTCPTRTTGVVAIAQPDSRIGREVICGNDWYYMRQGRMYGGDHDGLVYQLLHHFADLEWIGQGAMASRELYEKIQLRACDEPGLPRMSAKRK